MLFLTNFIGIVAVAIVVFLCQRYGQWKRALLALLVVLGLSALLIQPLDTALHRLYVKHRVVRLIHKLVHVRPDIVSGRTKFDSINVTYRDGVLHVNVDGFMPRDLLVDKPGATDAQERVQLFQDYLSSDLGEPVLLEFDLIPVEMIEIRGKRPAPQGAEQERDKKNN